MGYERLLLVVGCLAGATSSLTPNPRLTAAPSAQVEPSLPHQWTDIVYPLIPAMDGEARIPLVRVSNGGAQGFRFDLIYVSQSDNVQLPRDADIVVRLHRSDGQVISLPPDDRRGQVGWSSGGLGGASFDHVYFFPWQENTLEEAWIECRLPSRTYWIEIPYGFTRNPTDPLKSIKTLTGSPVLAPSMQSMGEKDQILPWVYATYDLGEIQNRWRASVQVSNPGDAKAEVVLYRNDGAVGRSRYLWNIQAPRTSIDIADPSGRIVTALAMGTRLHEDGMRRSDSFAFNRDVRGEERSWGTATVRVDDREYQFTLPSSLFRYLHGIVGTYPKAPIRRKAPY
jgi:hypothetical protein